MTTRERVDVILLFNLPQVWLEGKLDCDRKICSWHASPSCSHHTSSWAAKAIEACSHKGCCGHARSGIEGKTAPSALGIMPSKHQNITDIRSECWMSNIYPNHKFNHTCAHMIVKHVDIILPLEINHSVCEAITLGSTVFKANTEQHGWHEPITKTSSIAVSISCPWNES